MFPGADFPPTILWVTLWVSPCHVSKFEIDRTSNKNFGRGKAPEICYALLYVGLIGFLHYPTVASVRTIFSVVGFQFGEFPVNIGFSSSLR